MPLAELTEVSDEERSEAGTLTAEARRPVYGGAEQCSVGVTENEGNSTQRHRDTAS
jgi:hypothetical protein